MSLFRPRQHEAQRQLEGRLRPYLRSRGQRAADLSGLKASEREIAAALLVANGSIAGAQRLLVRTAGVDLGRGYVNRRVKESPALTKFLGDLRLKGGAKRWAGRLVCGECGNLVQPAPATGAQAPNHQEESSS